MSRVLSGRRCAFTRIELIVVIVVLAIGLILLPAYFRNAREKARMNICLSNMRQVGLAVQSYESKDGSAAYPGYKSHLKLADGTDYKARRSVGAAVSPYPQLTKGQTPVQGEHAAITWIIELFPYLDQQWQYDAFRGVELPLRGGTYTYVELVVCPSDPPVSVDRKPISIVVNTGMRDGNIVGHRDYRANGVFHDHYTDHPDSPSGRELKDEKQQRVEKVTSAYIDRKGDGLQYTLMLSENVDAGSYLDTDERFLGFTWAVPTEPVDTTTKPWSAKPPDKFHHINQGKGLVASQIEDPAANPDGRCPDDAAPYFYNARPSSNHPGGVNVVFCDGHGLFLSEKIDYYVYVMLMTPKGNAVMDPATGKPIDLLGFYDAVGPPKFDEAWIKR